MVGFGRLPAIRFQSTPSEGRATVPFDQAPVFDLISIHALRGEGDSFNLRSIFLWRYFNPRPPRGGRPLFSLSLSCVLHFNPRPPRGGRQRRETKPCGHWHFNPRPPRGGRRVYGVWLAQRKHKFQSTPSEGRATRETSFWDLSF